MRAPPNPPFQADVTLAYARVRAAERQIVRQMP